jgi:DNA-binding MarR family transcriptional regulator
MEKTLKIINELEEKGLIKKYAIGGGIAAIFYIEPILTYDIDIFFVPEGKEDDLLVRSSLYQYLEKRGYSTEKEHIVVEGIPVQFLPAFNELIEEAVNEAIQINYKNTAIKVMKLEYLIAIMLQTYRQTDRERIIKVLNEAEFDRDLLEKLLNKFDLRGKFETFMEMFNGD